MNDLVRWWHDAGGQGLPHSPLLVIAGEDDPQAVSVLPEDYARTWQPDGTATGRVAAHLGVTVVRFGQPLPEHDLLLLGEVGRGLTSLVSRLAVGMYGAEAQLVVGHGSGIDDVQWMTKVQRVRDEALDDPPSCVSSAAALLEASTVPVLLDGVLSAAAAAIADTGASLLAPVLGGEPAQRLLLERAEVPVWGVSGLGPGEGLGALSGLASLQLALLATPGT